jgi:hypothetical protein
MSDKSMGDQIIKELSLHTPESIRVVEGDGAPPPPEPENAACAVFVDDEEE